MYEGASIQTDSIVHLKNEKNSQEMFEKEGQCDCRNHDDYENLHKILILN